MLNIFYGACVSLPSSTGDDLRRISDLHGGAEHSAVYRSNGGVRETAAGGGEADGVETMCVP